MLQVRSEGRKKYYSPTGMTMVAGLTGILGEEIRRVTTAFLSEAENAKSIFKPKIIPDPSQFYLFNDDEES